MADHNEARERVLEAAEKLFAEKGYNSVTLRDIAAEVGIKHASLYHHVPGGKEQLYVEVAERSFNKHRYGLKNAIDNAAPDVRSKLVAAADYLLAQPPVDMLRMKNSDIPSLESSQAIRLELMAFNAMLSPVENILVEAKTKGEIQHPEPGVIAGGLFGMIESLHAIPDRYLEHTRLDLAITLIDAMLQGIQKSK
jgi:AcrR family transcriptional regulator